jgi:hypothetical protein
MDPLGFLWAHHADHSLWAAAIPTLVTEKKETRQARLWLSQEVDLHPAVPYTAVPYSAVPFFVLLIMLPLLMNLFNSLLHSSWCQDLSVPGVPPWSFKPLQEMLSDEVLLSLGLERSEERFLVQWTVS